MNEQQLWETFQKATRDPAEACPDFLTLASYIDGRLDARECDRIELHLSRCDICLESVAALRTPPAERSEPSQGAPLDLIGMQRDVRTRLQPVNMPGWRPWQRMAASLLLAAVMGAGYRAGEEAYAREEQAMETLLGAELDDVAVAWDAMPIPVRPEQHGGAS